MKKIIIIAMLLFFISILSFSAIKYGGEATVGLTTIQVQNNFNPFSPNCQYFLKGGILYEPLFFINNMTGTEEPWLATSYEWKNDNKELVFKLRENVKWSDGSDFTAEDVVFTFNLMKEKPALDLSGIWNSSLEEVRAIDKYTVSFVLSEIDVPIYSDIAGTIAIIPKKYWENVEDPITYLYTEAVGTGPFVVERIDEAAQIVVLKKNGLYWNSEKPYIDSIKLRIFQSNDANNLALLKGELDWASSFIPDVQKVYVSKNPEVNLAWAPSTTPVFMFLNLTKSPFDKAEFRKALSMAINKAKIAEVAEYGYTPAAHPSGMQMGFVEKWFDKSLEDLVYSYDPEQAAALFEKAGFKKNSDGKLINPDDGKPVSFDLMVVTGWTDWITTAKFVSKDLKELGIEVNVAPVSYGQYTQTLYTGVFDTALGGPDKSGQNPYYAYNRIMNSAFTAPVGEQALANFIRWRNEDSDKALNSFKKSTDFDAQKEYITVLARQMLTEVPSIPMFYTPVVEEYSARRFIGWPSEENPYCSAEPWAMPTPGVIMQNIHLK